MGISQRRSCVGKRLFLIFDAMGNIEWVGIGNGRMPSTASADYVAAGAVSHNTGGFIQYGGTLFDTYPKDW